MEKESLQGQAAVDLWLQGKTIWNQWVDDHPDAFIDFSHVEFPKVNDQQQTSIIDFIGYHFPSGGVSFEKTKFGDATDVLFNDTVFGQGPVIFYHTPFDGNVIFSNAHFAGPVNFLVAQFQKGMLDFSQATFEDDVSFWGAKFSCDLVDFSHTHFQKGSIDLSDTHFQQTQVCFDHARFSEGNFNLTNVHSQQSGFSFTKAYFNGFVDISFQENGSVNDLNFFSAKFDYPLNLEVDCELNCIPNFISSQISSHLYLGNIEQHFSQMHQNTSVAPSPDLTQFTSLTPEESIHRICRLKEIAESNRAHQQALTLYIIEQRLKRSVHKQPLKLISWLFDCACQYGRNILRPLYLLSTLMLCVTFLQLEWADKINPGYPNTDQVFYSLDIAIEHLLPSFGLKREASLKSMSVLGINPQLHTSYHLLFAIYTLLSCSLIFMILLSIRNRFRL